MYGCIMMIYKVCYCRSNSCYTFWQEERDSLLHTECFHYITCIVHCTWVKKSQILDNVPHALVVCSWATPSVRELAAIWPQENNWFSPGSFWCPPVTQGLHKSFLSLALVVADLFLHLIVVHLLLALSGQTLQASSQFWSLNSAHTRLMLSPFMYSSTEQQSWPVVT